MDVPIMGLKERLSDSRNPFSRQSLKLKPTYPTSSSSCSPYPSPPPPPPPIPANLYTWSFGLNRERNKTTVM